MAYGYPYQTSYFNTNYMPPQMPQMPQMPQASPLPQMPQAQSAQQQPGSNVQWVYVNGVQGAREQIVQPGQTLWMMDNNDPVIHIKAVDSLGTSTLRSFRLTEISGQEAPSAPAAPAIDMSQFATRAEVDALSAQLNKLIGEIGGVAS